MILEHFEEGPEINIESEDQNRVLDFENGKSIETEIEWERYHYKENNILVFDTWGNLYRALCPNP